MSQVLGNNQLVFDQQRRVKTCTKCKLNNLCSEHAGLYGAADVQLCNDCKADTLCQTHYNMLMNYSQQAKVTEIKKPIIEKTYEQAPTIIRHDENPVLETH
jgi:hypothetical protein